MADLDDFFAKKDRKKSKTSTKKFASTAEELVKQIEDTSAKKNDSRPVVRKESAAGLSSGGGAVDVNSADGSNADGAEQPVVVVEDEWKEFVAEERKDYTGLKIGQLQIADDDDDATDEGAFENYENDGELNADGERQRSGPWKKVEEGAAGAAAAAEPAAAPAPAGGEKSFYVSPAMRNASQFGLAQQRAKLRKGVLPDIHDQEFFPVLGSAKPEEVKKKRPEPGFEEVRHGGRLQRPSEMGSNAPVSIGNRFNSLADS